MPEPQATDPMDFDRADAVNGSIPVSDDGCSWSLRWAGANSGGARPHPPIQDAAGEQAFYNHGLGPDGAQLLQAPGKELVIQVRKFAEALHDRQNKFKRRT